METEEEKAAREAEEAKAAELKKQEEDAKLNLSEDEKKVLKDKEDKAKAEKLLDGTDKDKKILIKKTAYDDRNEKAKLYEAHAGLLDEVLKDPDLIKNFIFEKKGNDVESRIARIEESEKAKKRLELKEAVTDMLGRFEGFESSWADVQPIAESLMRQGYAPKEAMKRGYLAVHPEAAGAESERIAREAENNAGSFRGDGAHPVRTDRISRASVLTEDEKKLFYGKIQKEGIIKTEEEYAKVLEKHKAWIEKSLRAVGEL